MNEKNRRIEFGDFQTPSSLAEVVCRRLVTLGINPKAIIEPTCGVGAFVLAAAQIFTNTKEIFGFDINNDYINTLIKNLPDAANGPLIQLKQANFFETSWKEKFDILKSPILILGNFPWVTNTKQSEIKGLNLPEKTNFLNHKGLDAITGKANFDISEWMLLETLNWLEGRTGDLAMLVKSSVARKILAHTAQQKLHLQDAYVISFDAKQYFGASVDACLLIMRFSANIKTPKYDYTVFDSFEDSKGHRVGHRDGFTVSNLEIFESNASLLGQSPQKWRSGIKHDATAVMEFILTEQGLKNGLDEIVDIETTYLYPLMKGSDVGNINKQWREKYILVPQRVVGEETSIIKESAPKTWSYLEKHAEKMDTRASVIYKKNPRFSIFGIGEYAFLPWRIAICGLYKSLNFRLVAPFKRKPVMFDDTVYYISFATKTEAINTLNRMNSEAIKGLLTSMIFWDEKRPIKTSVLNVVDWTQVEEKAA